MWDKASVVKVSSKISPKLLNKGVTLAFVGYTENHTGDCYHIWDLVTHYIYITYYHTNIDMYVKSMHQFIKIPFTIARKRIVSNQTVVIDNILGDKLYSKANEINENELISILSKLKVKMGSIAFILEDSNFILVTLVCLKILRYGMY